MILIYFSKTGNTEYIARYLYKKLSKMSLSLYVSSIEFIPLKAIDDFDLLIVGFPVFYCDAPSLFLSFWDHCSVKNDKGIFLFCTSGGFAGNALKHNLKLLKAF